jgi:HEAT repeat protein
VFVFAKHFRPDLIKPRPTVAVFLTWSVCVCAALAQQDPPDRATDIPRWASELQHKDPSVRWYAAHALGQLGPAAAEAVGPLRKMLPRGKEPDDYVHGTAAWAIGRMGPAARPAIPALVECLGAELDASERAQSVHASARRNAAWALGQFGTAARVAVPELVKLLDDEDPVVRVQAAAALWRIDRHAKAAAKLLEMLRAREGTGSYAAAAALGELGPGVPGALEALVEALGHPDEDTQRTASRSLGRFGPRTVPVLRTLLTSGDAGIRNRAAKALEWMGSIGDP